MAIRSAALDPYRSRVPSETLAKVRPFFDLMGITRIANVTGLDTIGIPTVMVTRPNSRCLSVTQGKGATLEAAKASGVMEATEHYHAERIELPLRFTTERELERRHLVANVTRLPQYRREYHSDCRILWIEGATVSGAEPVWVPYEMVHLDLTLPLPSGSGFFLPGSNGLASGNTTAEAILHGIHEVIERDALTLFYQMSVDEQAARRMDLGTVESATARELLERYERAEVDVAVWDITSDVGIASFLCMILDRETEVFHPTSPARGSGTHCERTIALERALCETAQSRLTRMVGTRDDLSSASAEDARLRDALRRAREQILGMKPTRSFAEVPSASFGSPPAAVDHVCRKLVDSGQDPPIQVDLSRPELPVSVVRVVVPGLEGLSQAPGFVPGLRSRLKQEAPP